jgi:hypothetical protein
MSVNTTKLIMKKYLIIGALLGVAVINSQAQTVISLPIPTNMPLTQAYGQAMQAAKINARAQINQASLAQLQAVDSQLGSITNLTTARNVALMDLVGKTNLQDVIDIQQGLPWPTNRVGQYQRPPIQ